MSYTRPIKTIASAGGLYSKRLAQAELPEIFSTDTEPTVKTNGDPLMDGDYWYHTTTLELKIYITNEFVLVAGPGTLKVIEDKITVVEETITTQGSQINNHVASIGDLGSQINALSSRISALESA